MNEVEFTKGDLTSSGVHIIDADGFKISQALGDFTAGKEDEANALLFSKANKMYGLLSRLQGFNAPPEHFTEDELDALIEIKPLLAQIRGDI